MKPIIRSATEKDLVEIASSLDHSPRLRSFTDFLSKNKSSSPNYENLIITILEIEGKPHGVLVWSLEKDQEIVLVVFWTSDEARKTGLDVRLLRREILTWAAKKILKVQMTVFESESLILEKTLITCGFFHEGIEWSSTPEGENSIRFGKKLIYQSIPHSSLVIFLEKLFVSLGYETRSENGALLYRLGPGHQPPLVSSSWHRISRQGPNLIVSPPARPLESHELETLFFPLIIEGHHESPLMVTLDKKRAMSMIDMPREETKHENLFFTENSARQILRRNLVYTFPTGFHEIRKGLPILFYVNGIGAVGQARIGSWTFEDPRNLCKALYDDEKYDLDHVREHVGLTGPKKGKTLVLSYEYYRVFKRPVSLEAMKVSDNDFNPQRQRSISYEFFKSICGIGTE
jgi:hypothetical protein